MYRRAHDWQQEQFRPPGLTRRGWLGAAASAAAGAYGLVLGVPAAVPQVWAAPDFKLRAPEPHAKRGGVLRYGILSAPAHFDVHQSGTVSNIGTQGAMYDNLIRRNPLDSGQTIIPDLAHSWEIAPDSKTYTFFLRQGVQFHDGAALTADDVKATYARLIWPPQGFSSPRTPLFSAVRDIKVRDAHTVEFHLHEARPQDFMLGPLLVAGTLLCARRPWRTTTTTSVRSWTTQAQGRFGIKSGWIKRSG